MSVRRVRALGVLAWGAALVSSCRIGYELLPLDGGGTAGMSGSSTEGGAPIGVGGAPTGDGGAPVVGGVPNGDSGESGMPSSAGAPDAGAGGAPDVPPRCTVPVSPIIDYCTSIPRLTEAVAFDGEVDCGLMPIEIAPQGWVYDPSLLDATAHFAAAWDEGGVYFYLDVRDPSPVLAEVTDPLWMGDGVELYLDTDGSYQSPPSYDAIGTRQISIGRANSDGSGVRGQINADAVAGFPVDWTPPQQVTVTATDEGYVVEAYIPGSVLGVPDWVLSAGSHIGLDAGVNVSCVDAQTTCSQGHRLGQFFYHQSTEPAGEPYRNVNGFCNPLLAE